LGPSGKHLGDLHLQGKAKSLSQILIEKRLKAADDNAAADSTGDSPRCRKNPAYIIRLEQRQACFRCQRGQHGQIEPQVACRTLLLPENYCQDNDGYENP
jgi:hypothetical protein